MNLSNHAGHDFRCYFQWMISPMPVMSVVWILAGAFMPRVSFWFLIPLAIHLTIRYEQKCEELSEAEKELGKESEC